MRRGDARFLLNALCGAGIRSIRAGFRRRFPARHRPVSEMLSAAHILCLVSRTSAALKQAAHLARHFDATLHVVPQPRAGDASDSAERSDPPRGGGDPLSAERGDGVSVQRPQIVPESPSAVLEYVRDSDIDLVVSDTPPDRGPVPSLATEITQTLVQQLTCPVFIVEREARPTAIQDLLVPTDLSASALQAFKHAVALARLYDASVHVLHVVDSLPYVALTPTDRLSLGATPLSEHRGRRRLRAFLREGDTADVPIHAHLAYGDAADQVLRFVERGNIDLLVLSSHGSGHRSHVPLGAVTERVLGRATCPLFLVRTFGATLLSSSASSDADSVG